MQVKEKVFWAYGSLSLYDICYTTVGAINFISEKLSCHNYSFYISFIKEVLKDIDEDRINYIINI